MKSSEKYPLVGIALLTYNYGRYMDDMLESLKKQTFQDFEIYLLDDGSNDNYTPDKIKSLDYDKIVKKLCYTKNLGNAVRRRELYNIIKNKYIVDLAADDMLEPTFLEKTVEFLENNSKYGAVSTDVLEYMDTFEGEPFTTLCFDTKKMGLPAMISECHCLGSSLMRNEALKNIDLTGGFTRYQDWDRWISMLEAGWKIGLISEPLFRYRLHKDSLSHSSNAEIETETFRKIIKKHSALFQKYGAEIATDLFRKFQESGFFNKALTRDYLALKKENEELRRELEQNKPSIFKRAFRRVKITVKARLRR